MQKDEAFSSCSSLAPSAIEARADQLDHLRSPCVLCPRRCGARRREGARGWCGLAEEVIVASAGPHFGEEDPLVGRGGSGTIFFASCNLDCVFCQNWQISRSTRGETLDAEGLAGLMLHLQARGCGNINLVTPTHVVHGVIRALAIAVRAGLRVPLVYNSGGYDSVGTLRILDGLVDIYMPDVKYGSNEEALRYSGVADYWDRAREAVHEMHRQVGDLCLDCRGRAVRGLLVRHLVLPGGLAGTGSVVDFIAREISRDTWVNIMGQYRPCHRAPRIPELSRTVTRAEHARAVEEARRAGLSRGLPCRQG